MSLNVFSIPILFLALAVCSALIFESKWFFYPEKTNFNLFFSYNEKIRKTSGATGVKVVGYLYLLFFIMILFLTRN